MRELGILLILAAVLFLMLLSAASAKCVLVGVDGDSIRHNCHDVRLRGFNAPEHAEHGARCEREIRLAKKAQDELNRLLQRGRTKGTLEIRYQRKRDGSYKLGKYKRRLANVIVDGEDVGAALIRKGLAHKMDYDAGERRIRDYWCR